MTIESKIEKTLDEEIRPMLMSHGGNAELVSFSDGVVTVALQGACHGCPMAGMTLKNMVEAILCDNIPEVKSVVNANDEGNSMMNEFNVTESE